MNRFQNEWNKDPKQSRICDETLKYLTNRMKIHEL